MSQVFPKGAAASAVNATIAGPLAGFGEMQTTTPTPSSQLDFIYTVNDMVTLSTAYGAAAAVTSSNGEAAAACGTANDGYARLQGRRVVRYRPGQGSMVRITARFDAPAANNRQLVGVTNVEAGYQFGYNGTTFGILHTEAGTVEVRTLTITTGSSTAENVTVTLNGAATSVAVTNSASTLVTANQIAAGNYSQASGGWTAFALGSVVYFVRRITGAAVGAFSLTATTAVGAFATVTAGTSTSETFYPQSSWSVNAASWLDPSKGNVYQIQYQYLGYGNAFFGVEDPTTGRFTPVHMVTNANRRTSTVLRNPSGYVTWESRNTGNTTSVAIRGASAASFTEGNVVFLGPRFGYTNTKTINATTLTPVLTLRSSPVFSSRMSTLELKLDRMAVSADGTKPVVLYIYRNATLTGQNYGRVDATRSAADVDIAATAVSGGQLVYSFTIGKTGDATDDLSNLDLVVSPGDTLTLAAYSANASDVSATFAWSES